MARIRVVLGKTYMSLPLDLSLGFIQCSRLLIPHPLALLQQIYSHGLFSVSATPEARSCNFKLEMENKRWAPHTAAEDAACSAMVSSSVGLKVGGGRNGP